MQNPAISFLLGSGFSKPAGFPLASEINERFVGIKESDLSISSDGTAWFHQGNPSPNDGHMWNTKRLFVERLLDYYCNLVIAPGSFCYETFYDWYKDLRDGRSADPRVADIAAKLGQDTGNLLLDFDLIFNQLLAQLLGKRFSAVHFCRGFPSSHAIFLELVERLGQKHVLHFHSLNQDLFFESLSNTDAMKGGLSDGFLELGSPYYGKFQHYEVGANGENLYSYTGRLPRFVDKFDSNFNLYKLHGSIDHYIYLDAEYTTVKNMWGIRPRDLMKEVSRNGALEYEKRFDTFHPNFLSGTTWKKRHYSSTPYYSKVFEHFKSNLERSHVLIVIGYGFGDAEINRFVQDHLLSRGNSKILIIDVRKPALPSGFSASSEFFGDGVEKFDYEALLVSIRAKQPGV